MAVKAAAPKAAAPRTRRISHLNLDERLAKGRAARDRTPPSSHAGWSPAADRPDPVGLLVEQGRTREQDLVPVRHGRMMVSPFTFYRGAAKIMATDLKGTPTAGLGAQLCGDAHLSNFGFFASPERRLVFDLNDFDETLRGPWEWDVKRLAASIEVAARYRGFGRADRTGAVAGAVREYRRAMTRFAARSTLGVWYAVADVEGVLAQVEHELAGTDRKQAARQVAKARTRDHLGALGRFATVVHGVPRIAADPPRVVPLRDLMPGQPDRHGI